MDLFNGRAAMFGFLIGVISEAITGQGLLHQVGLGTRRSRGDTRGAKWAKAALIPLTSSGMEEKQEAGLSSGRNMSFKCTINQSKAGNLVSGQMGTAQQPSNKQ